MTAEELNHHLNYKAARALMVSRCEAKPKIVRDVCAAYLNIHRNMAQYMRAAIGHPAVKAWIEGDIKPEPLNRFDVAEFMLNMPAVWEFEFTKIVGTVNDANWCAHQYKWVSFIGVRPLPPEYPVGMMRIPIFHKSNSRFRLGYDRRNELKRALGSKLRPIVNYARGHTKKEFLENFYMPAPDRSKMQKIEYPGGMVGYSDIAPYRSKGCTHMEAHELLNKTGYTPEDFWREVRNPLTVAPFKHHPQLDLIPFKPTPTRHYLDDK